MGYYDLETWNYREDSHCARYESPSRTIVILKEIGQDSPGWRWRVYDNGIPEVNGEALVSDDGYDHELGCFADAWAAYNDVRAKGMERTAYQA